MARSTDFLKTLTAQQDRRLNEIQTSVDALHVQSRHITVLFSPPLVHCLDHILGDAHIGGVGGSTSPKSSKNATQLLHVCIQRNQIRSSLLHLLWCLAKQVMAVSKFRAVHI